MMNLRYHLIKKKWIVVVALSVVTLSLLFATVHVYAMNKENKESILSEISANVKKVQEMKERNMRHALNGDAAALIDAAQEVAAAEAAVLPEETAEIPEEEILYEEEYVEEYYYEEPFEISYPSIMDVYYTAGELKFQGVLYAGGWRWTWYSQNVLPGGGLHIPGRHVDESGFVCDGNGRICLASSDLPKGTIVATPFGKEGCVYDCGCASGTLDVYVNF